jgi:hypothetical protein
MARNEEILIINNIAAIFNLFIGRNLQKVVFTSFNFLTHFSFKKVFNTLKGLSHEMDLAFVISRKDKNKKLTLLSQHELALTALNTLFAL